MTKRCVMSRWSPPPVQGRSRTRLATCAISTRPTERFGFLVLHHTLGTATAVKFATGTEIARQNPGMSTLEVLIATNAAISDTPRAIGAPPSVGARVGAMAYDTLELMSHMLLEGLAAFDQGSAGMPQLG